MPRISHTELPRAREAPGDMLRGSAFGEMMGGVLDHVAANPGKGTWTAPGAERR